MDKTAPQERSDAVDESIDSVWTEAAMLDHDIAIDFMDMRDDGRVWARLADARPGLVPIAGRYAIVGCTDADPAVAKILRVDHQGHIELRVLPGDVESHRDLLTYA